MIRLALAATLMLALVSCASNPAPVASTGASAPVTATMAAEPVAAPAAAPAPAPTADSLYKRLGGYDAIAAVTDDFLGRMIADKQLGRYFVGMSQNSREVLREHVIEFLCFYAKGPCLYIGRDLGEVHTGLKISEADWNAAVQDLIATLEKFRVPAREQNELIQLVAGFKEDIVGK